QASVIWLLYIALEPYIRRHWPQTIISWSRLISGRFRDPIVGRDVLFGVVLALIWGIIFTVRTAALSAAGPAPRFDYTGYLNGMRDTLAACLLQILYAVRTIMVFFFMLFVLRALLRNRWAAGAAFVLIWTLLQTLGRDQVVVNGITNLAVYTIAAF